MMLEFESLVTLRTLELPQHSALVVAYHVALQTVDVRECLVAHFAGLLTEINKKCTNGTHCTNFSNKWLTCLQVASLCQHLTLANLWLWTSKAKHFAGLLAKTHHRRKYRIFQTCVHDADVRECLVTHFAGHVAIKRTNDTSCEQTVML
jgi:hypothetical protein